ncbi:MAG: hypothetical protein IKQ41_02190 [Clostridia bacterium]|nr:hypothetical protein [Clostridia bacterium]
MKRLKAHFHRYMIRSLIYKVFTRGILALFAAQLIRFFAPPDWPLARFSSLALMLGLLFALFAVLAWLRCDGLRIPQLRLPRVKRRDPPFLNSDISDHIDDEIVAFDDLDEEEQNVCVLLADALLSALCFALSAIV